MNPSDASSLLPDLPQGAEILIVRPRSLGDIVLETPAISALHSWRHDLKVWALIEPRFAAVLEGNSAVAGVLFSKNFPETAKSIRKKHFPIVFNQHGGPRSAWLTAVSGAAARVGWKGFQYSPLYNVRTPDAAEFYGRPIVHTVEHRISQFYWAGLPSGPISRAVVFPQPDAAARVERFLQEHGVAPGATYAVLQPGARTVNMRWPIAKFAAIARWLQTEHGIACVMNLPQQDRDLVAQAQEELGGRAVLATQLNLRELIALIAKARLLVGNDSGPAHIAAATGTPSVVIYGPTNPAQWRPWASPHSVVTTGATFRVIRGDKTVPNAQPRSIASIEVDEVCAACEARLAADSSNNSRNLKQVT